MAGKSNLMDAISFVFGVASQHLRGTQAKDLVHRFNGEPPANLSCHVKLLFVDADGEETTFQRSIRPSDGSSTYSVNNKRVSFEQYLQSLHDIHIFPKLKNFLIFQGSVEQVATKSSKQVLCRWFF